MLLPPRPLVLSFLNSGSAPDLEIDNVSLLDATGQELIHNGDFSKHHQRWFFECDNHLAWHIKNLFAEVLFEQGWFGLSAFLTFLLAVALYLFKETSRNFWFTSGYLASITGFIANGLFDSSFDVPRLTTLFLLVTFFSLLCGCKTADHSVSTKPAEVKRFVGR